MGAGQILLVNAEVTFLVLGKFGCGRLFAECNLSSSIGGEWYGQPLKNDTQMTDEFLIF